MADFVSKEKRSKIMAAIKGRNTSIELLLRKELTKRGLRYRVHHDIPGRPDIAFPRWKVAVFTDGCFWHKCPRCYRPPTSNRQYWLPKLAANVRRDKRQTNLLRKQGWRVLRFWEHAVRGESAECAAKISGVIKSRSHSRA
jgi:DNA mismatch endonuclease (patch repair protein)